MANMIQLTVGAGVNRPQGQRLKIPVSDNPVESLRTAVSKLPAIREMWLAGGLFDGDYRHGDRWVGQQTLWCDADYANKEGEHVALPDDVKADVELAVESNLLPGNVAYLTPRGLRVGFLLTEVESDPARAGRALRGAGALLDEVLSDITPNLRVDRAALDLPRLMFAPNAQVNGEARRASVFGLRTDPYLIQELLKEATTTKTGKLKAKHQVSKRLPGYLDSMLRKIDPDRYETWTTVGMGLRYEFGDAGFHPWNKWSATSSKYPGRDECWLKWLSFQRVRGKVVTFDTVHRLARQEGWAAAEAFAEEPEPDPEDGSAVLLRMSDVTPRPIDWLWKDRFPTGRLSLISAPPGAGKSYFTHYMAARVSTNTPWADETRCEGGSVVLVSCEDDPADTIRPRLDACGARVDRVHVLTGVRRIDPRTNEKSLTAFTLDDLKPLDNALTGLGDARLVVIDPIGSYFGGDKDSHVDTEVRALLAPLAELARKHRVAIVLVAHTRKSFGGSADDGVLGSRAFTGLARCVHHIFRDPANQARRLLLPGKSNLGAERKGLAFRLLGAPIPSVVFDDGEVKMTADEMAARTGQRTPPNRAPVRSAVTEWLQELLVTGKRRSAGDVQKMARAAGLCWRTVQRAARDLGVKPQRNGFADGGWFWELPKPDGPPPEPLPDDVSKLLS